MTAATDTRKRSTGLAGTTNLAVLAPLRTGMVPNFEPIGYAHRLEKVLDALQASRRNLRESELLSVFPDVIGRFGIIRHFRYALVEPERGPDGQPNDDGTWRLSLNVTFDGGWEPYMRVIYRDIGTLLDLLFCHSPDYPGSRTSSFEDYCKWVRKYEVPAGLFYADSAATMEDQAYLSGLEALTRTGKATAGELVRHALPSGKDRDRMAMAKALQNPARVLAVPLRTLRGLYRLSTYFPGDASQGQGTGDAGVLWRFAREVLKDAIGLMQKVEVLSSLPAPPPPMTPEQFEMLKKSWAAAKAGAAEELAWLRWSEPASSPTIQPGSIDPQKPQAHVLSEGEKMTHGCIALLRVKNAQDARKTLAALEAKCGPVAADGDVGALVAFTYPGLEALEISAGRLAALPQEFFEGMESRCGLLGDLRANHPDRWSRPALCDSAGQPRASGQQVDLGTVHVLVQFRIRDVTSSDKESQLHPRLKAEAAALGASGSGLVLMAVEGMRSYRDAAEVNSVGHLDMADGLSQPQPVVQGKPVPATDLVSAGELLLGHGNDRGDDPKGTPDILQDGTFLVVRKLRQWMDRLDNALARYTPAEREIIRAKMMGRTSDGDALFPVQPKGSNHYDYDDPAHSAACPFASHARRANPRDGRAYTPRILRRGMSYGEKSATERTKDRGVMFMAYCASIAEQFETIQRWVAGGNSSGVSSNQGDPFLRVPREGEDSHFQYAENGGVRTVKFDDKPLVTLQWGLYTFVPSRAVLKSLDDYVKDEAAADAPATEPDPGELERVRAMLEDRHRGRNARTWAKVRGRKPDAPQDKAYGLLLGTAEEVLAAMKDVGKRYSVSGYGERKDASVGINLLGMDPSDPRRQAEAKVNDVIASIDEATAFCVAQQVVDAVLAQLPTLPAGPGDPERRPVDLVTFSDHVLAALCKTWFGLPDEKHMFTGGRVPGNAGAPRCPGTLGFPSRYVFTPQVTAQVKQDGEAEGRKVRKAVQDWLATKPALPSLSRAMEAELKKTNSEGRLAENIAGMMLGFTPTVQGNFLRVMDNWIGDGRTLWDAQQLLYEEWSGGPLSFQQARDALRDPIFTAMRNDPVPGMLWRRDLKENKVAVLGIASALTDPAAPRELVFGRDGDDAKEKTVHGCPGYHMAMGVLLAMVGGLLKRGNLRPTGSPVLLILTPNAAPPASP